MSAEGTLPGEVLSLLLVTSDDQREESLLAVLLGTPHTIRRVSCCSEALQLLNDLNADVLLVDADMPTGNWKNLLDCALSLPLSPPLIVFSRFADDHLWAEVLNLGGYDVLAAPFEAEEVLRTISLASASRSHKLAAESSSPLGGPARSIAAA